MRSDGRLVPVSLTGSPIMDPSGTVVALSAVARDISDRVRAEEAFRERVEAMQHALEGMGRVDAAGAYHAMNRSFAATLGYSVGELPRGDWFDVVAPDDRPRAMEAFRRMRSEGRVALDLRLKARSGSAVPAHFTMVRATDRGGLYRGFHAFYALAAATPPARESAEPVAAEDV